VVSLRGGRGEEGYAPAPVESGRRNGDRMRNGVERLNSPLNRKKEFPATTALGEERGGLKDAKDDPGAGGTRKERSKEVNTVLDQEKLRRDCYTEVGGN